MKGDAAPSSTAPSHGRWPQLRNVLRLGLRPAPKTETAKPDSSSGADATAAWKRALAAEREHSVERWWLVASAARSATRARQAAYSAGQAELEAFAIPVVALLVAIVAGAVHCGVAVDCVHHDRCLQTGGQWVGCGFVNVVDLAADRLYNASRANVSLATLTRGSCTAGERRQADGVCVPLRSYPSALEVEVQDPASGMQHTRWCGAWIYAHAGGVRDATLYYSFYDEAHATAAVEAAEAEQYASPWLSHGDAGKFYAACTRTVLGGAGAIRAAARLAYADLKPTLTGGNRAAALRALGRLASHSCPGPLQLGIGVDAGKGVFPAAVRGALFAEGELARALFVMEESAAMQLDAEAAADVVDRYAFDSPRAVTADYELVFEGAVADDTAAPAAAAAAASFMPPGINLTDTGSDDLKFTITPEFDGLLILLNRSDAHLVDAYLAGLAASCALAIQQTLDTELQPVLLDGDKPAARALGRLELTPDAVDAHLFSVGDEAVRNASAVTWAQLQPRPTGKAAEDCLALTRYVMPDRIDAMHFGLVVPDALYAALEPMVADIREAVASALEGVVGVSDLFVPGAGASAAADVRAFRLRLPGAPRGTWAGYARPLADGELASTDGVMRMAVQQARAAFLDRHRLWSGAGGTPADSCDFPALFDSLTSNAYIAPSLGCTHILTGMLRRPFADARYDATSLRSRVGYVVAHEFAHVSLLYAPSAKGSELMDAYGDVASVRYEGLADVIAARSLVAANLVDANTLCAHVSQLWCGLSPQRLSIGGTPTHPAANVRGDVLCSLLGCSLS